MFNNRRKGELAELDHDFANQLQQAQEHLSDDDIRHLLDTHVRRRQEVIEQINAELNSTGSNLSGTQPDRDTDLKSLSIRYYPGDGNHATDRALPRKIRQIHQRDFRSATTYQQSCYTSSEAIATDGIASSSVATSTGSLPGQQRVMLDAGCEAQTSGKKDAATGPEPGTRDVTTAACQHEACDEKTLLTNNTSQASHTTVRTHINQIQNADAATEVGTNCVDAAVGDNVENNDTLLRSVAEMIDSFSQTTWARRDKLSPDDFNRLLSEHLRDIQNMRRIREVESRKLKEELKRRMMKINATQEEQDLSENSEDDTQSDTNFNARLRVERPRIDRLPATKEELESLLAIHVERQRQLLAMKATKRQIQDNKLRLILQQQNNDKTRDIGEMLASESDEFDYSEADDDSPPTHHTDDAATVDGNAAYEKTAPVTEIADDLIRAHRDRRVNLQRWRDEDKKVKNERLQEKLTERLKQKH
ncbi:hypothetical protein NP493_155g01018 [Ridgeia piscesae]|uniref:Uncharacterized protein n=1 Tax=Ridgeia piscesae TaxID=27915 RepID=A0AAD9P477_RIDPI|nr:hypothetical protein NP493_155g01018 [Ridgeia piscesae]